MLRKHLGPHNCPSVRKNNRKTHKGIYTSRQTFHSAQGFSTQLCTSLPHAYQKSRAQQKLQASTLPSQCKEPAKG
jgi:hypothetical protein